ncbi:MAG: protein O-mannosyl-transferase family [Bacteroidales bacterium]
MGNFNKINNVIGWLIFIISTAVYALTIEPTASWWDAGEFIATTYKLEVGHPPGAPTYALLGRLFSIFTFGNTSLVAAAINFLSAVSTGATAMFFYWIIVLLGLKLVNKKEGGQTPSRLIAVMGSGIVGSLAAAFCDTIWFSAVEAEVYALSGFFTALTFWIALKWETVSDERQQKRYLIFIFFLIGVAIGVHLLNLLAIPAIFYLVYFKKYKPNAKGFIITGILSFAVLAFILFLFIPTFVRWSFAFEYLFVNSIGLPFNTGAMFFFLLTAAILIYAIYYTEKKQKSILNMIVLSLVFILVGFSTFFTVAIRANANPPINEYCPKDPGSFLSYFLRENYGSAPVFKGQYYNAPLIDQKDTGSIYAQDKKTGKYKEVSKKYDNIYDERFTTIFPRMYSPNANHEKYYKIYGDVKGKPVRFVNPYSGEEDVRYVPTFAENLRYFFNYQLGHMYVRYFLWNFAGRQNDIESQGEFNHGNWKSGIPVVDNSRIGPQDNLPRHMDNPGNTAFYFLPLILGLIGLIYQYNSSKQDFWVVLVLFLMTGLAIILYLNQSPLQPRERDYAYAASFMTFCIWIGLGSLAIFDWLESKVKNAKMLAVSVSVVTFLAVPTIMCASGYELHNRSGKYAMIDWARNYLRSCAPNAIIFTNGDNDTFPIWYAQEVEGIRTDVRLVCFTLAQGDWYCHQMGRKLYDSDRLPLSLSPNDYNAGTNDVLRVEGFGQKRHYELSYVMNNFIRSGSKGKKNLMNEYNIEILPTKKLKISVDKEAALKSGTVPAKYADQIVDELKWEIKGNMIGKNGVLLYDILATNNWERPIYFVTPSTPDIENILPLSKYLHREGMAFRLRPYVAECYDQSRKGGIDIERSWEALMSDEVRWGKLNEDGVVIDRQSEINVSFAKLAYRHLAVALIEANRNKEAIQVVDKCLEFFPDNKITFKEFELMFIGIYYRAGAFEKANELVRTLNKTYTEELLWYNRLDPQLYQQAYRDVEYSLTAIQRLIALAQTNNQKELAEEIQKGIEDLITAASADQYSEK